MAADTPALVIAPGSAALGGATRRRRRDMSRAKAYRARDILDVWGIPQSTLCEMARHADPARRPPSILILPRGGRRGIRLYPVAEFDAWVAQHRQQA